MKKIKSDVLIDTLHSDVREVIFQCNQLNQYSEQLLQQAPAAGKWSVAQVLEHLNIYSRYYISAIEDRLHLNQSGPDMFFKPGWPGNYFTKLMKPAENKTITKKMKAPKNAVPAAIPDTEAMLAECLQHQHHLLNLLQIAKNVNMNYIRIPISLNKYIKMKLGDTFRFLIAHDQRHFLQIENILAALKTTKAAA
jgi:DinB superfamily